MRWLGSYAELLFIMENVESHAVSQLSKDRYESANLLQCRLFNRESERASTTLDPLLDDLNLLFKGIRQGQNHRVEAALEGAREFVDSPVPIIRGRVG